LLGPAFREVAPLLAVHVWTCVFLAMGFARSSLWTLQHRNHYTLLATLFGSGLGTALNYLLIPRFGASACAWLAVLGALVTNLLATLIVSDGPAVFRAQLVALAGAGRLWRRRAVLVSAQQAAQGAERARAVDDQR
jgi:PST family polysaccharide transporter